MYVRPARAFSAVALVSPRSGPDRAAASDGLTTACDGMTTTSNQAATTKIKAVAPRRKRHFRRRSAAPTAGLERPNPTFQPPRSNHGTRRDTLPLTPGASRGWRARALLGPPRREGYSIKPSKAGP